MSPWWVALWALAMAQAVGFAVLWIRALGEINRIEEERDAELDEVEPDPPYSCRCCAPVVSAQFTTAPKSPGVVRHRTRNLRGER